MTQEEIVAHWQKGAQDALEAAEILHRAGKYALALFSCHLAVEKALKAVYIEQQAEAPVPTHNLFRIAQGLRRNWTPEQKMMMEQLTDYAVAARYDDPRWAELQATWENSAYWITQTIGLFTLLEL